VEKDTQSAPSFFTVSTASRVFFGGAVSPWTIRSWLRTGRLRGYKAGARVLLRREDLESFVKPRPVTPVTAHEARQ
jgi:excisionase family DNA binding protein